MHISIYFIYSPTVGTCEILNTSYWVINVLLSQNGLTLPSLMYHGSFVQVPLVASVEYF